MKPSVHVAAVFPLAALPSVSLHVFGEQHGAASFVHVAPHSVVPASS
jgi:hypothetical protein